MIAAAYGAGTNSTAMLIGMVVRGEPVDVIQFADTGGERPEVSAFVDTFSAWLVAHGYPAVQTVQTTTREGVPYTLEERCLKGKMLPSVVYGYKACSEKHKQRPQHKALRANPQALAVWAGGGKVQKLIGIDAGEPQRANIAEDRFYTFRYPLLEWGWDRIDCLEAIERAGLPQPGKSACFFCPNADEEEILQLGRTHPDLLARALAMEANAELTQVKGLGRRWVVGRRRAPGRGADRNVHAPARDALRLLRRGRGMTTPIPLTGSRQSVRPLISCNRCKKPSEREGGVFFGLGFACRACFRNMGKRA